MAMAASGGDLKQRVIRLVDHHCAPNNNISKWFASATIIFSIILLSSKQLLTMPLLDLWPDETPWQQTTKSKENQDTLNNNVTLLSPIFSESLPSITTPSTNQPTDSTFKTVLGKKALSTSNILTTLVSVDRPIDKKSDMDIVKRNSLALNNLQPNSDEPIQLKNSPKNTVTESEQLNKNNVNDNSLMVTKAFERTTSNNAYQQELIQLRDDSHIPNTFISNHATKKPQPNSVLNNEFTTLADKSETSKEMSLLNRAISKSRAVKKIAVASASAHLDKEVKVINIAPIRRNAKKLKSVNPIYPNIAKRKGIELEVEVNFTIDTNGKVKNLQFINQQKVSYFKSSIRSAIKKWRFLPAKVNGKPVESQMTKVFAFSLHS